jgi:AcrR family transcriptional regulator
MRMVMTIPPKRQGQSNARRELVSQEILEKSSALFAERGFANTSLQDVAQALEISRTSLYHYIGGKEPLLAELVHGLTRETADGLEKIAANEALDPLERLEAAVLDMTTRIANKPSRFRLLLLSEGSLPPALADEHRTARKRALQYLRSIIRAGMEAGQLRALDENVAAFSVLGMCNWVAWWYQPERNGGLRVEQVAAYIADLAIASLSTSAGRLPTGKLGPQHAIEILRKDLDYLERSLKGGNGS